MAAAAAAEEEEGVDHGESNLTKSVEFILFSSVVCRSYGGPYPPSCAMHAAPPAAHASPQVHVRKRGSEKGERRGEEERRGERRREGGKLVVVSNGRAKERRGVKRRE